MMDDLDTRDGRTTSSEQARLLLPISSGSSSLGPLLEAISIRAIGGHTHTHHNIFIYIYITHGTAQPTRYQPVRGLPGRTKISIYRSRPSTLVVPPPSQSPGGALGGPTTQHNRGSRGVPAKVEHAAALDKNPPSPFFPFLFSSRPFLLLLCHVQLSRKKSKELKRGDSREGWEANPRHRY